MLGVSYPLIVSSVGAAQTGISYQLLVYDSKQLPGKDFGQIKIRNRNVDIRFSILDNNMQVEYQEESTYTTDNMGFVNAVIGSSQQISGYSSGFENLNTSSKLIYELLMNCFWCR